MKLGSQALEFTLPDQDGQPYSLMSNLGRNGTVVFFYPKDHSGVCTAQACAFRDQYAVFKENGAVVIGISGDSQESHRSFSSQHRLPYPILSDADGAVRKLWGVPKKLGLVPGRVTYVLDGKGIVIGIHDDILHAEPHIAEALKALNL
jgi:peroxiredoxin Q/BCP